MKQRFAVLALLLLLASGAYAQVPTCAECDVQNPTSAYHHRGWCSSYPKNTGGTSGTGGGSSSTRHSSSHLSTSQQMKLETISMFGDMLGDILGTSTAAQQRKKQAQAEARRLEAERQEHERAMVARQRAEQEAARRQGQAAWEACKARQARELDEVKSWESGHVQRLMAKYKLVGGERPGTLTFTDMDETGRMNYWKQKPTGEPFGPLNHVPPPPPSPMAWKNLGTPSPNPVTSPPPPAVKKPSIPTAPAMGWKEPALPPHLNDTSVVDLRDAGDHPTVGLLRAPAASPQGGPVATTIPPRPSQAPSPTVATPSPIAKPPRVASAPAPAPQVPAPAASRQAPAPAPQTPKPAPPAQVTHTPVEPVPTPPAPHPATPKVATPAPAAAKVTSPTGSALGQLITVEKSSREATATQSAHEARGLAGKGFQGLPAPGVDTAPLPDSVFYPYDQP